MKYKYRTNKHPKKIQYRTPWAELLKLEKVRPDAKVYNKGMMSEINEHIANGGAL